MLLVGTTLINIWYESVLLYFSVLFQARYNPSLIVVVFLNLRTEMFYYAYSMYCKLQMEMYCTEIGF